MTNKWYNTVKEVLSKYFFDLSKLVFATIVLGGFAIIITDDYKQFNWYAFIGGLMTTIFLAILGYTILKR
jgi:hypothetical protein